MSHNCDARDRGTSDGRNSLVADCIGHIKRADIAAITDTLNGIKLSSDRDESCFNVDIDADGQYCGLREQRPQKICNSRDSGIAGIPSELSSDDNFVRLGKQAAEDDIFAPRSIRKTRSAGSSPSKRAEISTNWRSNCSSSTGSTFKEAVSELISDVDADMQVNSITSSNAQAHFPPSACIFVANLQKEEDEQTLEVAVTQTFRIYGHVYVKVRRDAVNNPYAFVQYTSDIEADDAFVRGQGTLILGRRCRIERSNGNVTYFLAHKRGLTISVDEAGQLLKHVGRVASIDLSEWQGKQGVMIKFMFFDTGKEALEAFRDSKLYTLTHLTKKEPRAGSKLEHQTKGASRPGHQNFMESYDVERRSIFVGNLPKEIDEGILRGTFKGFGKVIKVTIVRQNVRPDARSNNFAFLEFVDRPSAIRAVAQTGLKIGDNRLRVKERNDGRHHRPVFADECSTSFLSSPNTYSKTSRNSYPSPRSCFWTPRKSATSSTSYMLGGQYELPYQSPATTYTNTPLGISELGFHGHGSHSYYPNPLTPIETSILPFYAVQHGHPVWTGSFAPSRSHYTHHEVLAHQHPAGVQGAHQAPMGSFHHDSATAWNHVNDAHRCGPKANDGYQGSAAQHIGRSVASPYVNPLAANQIVNEDRDNEIGGASLLCDAANSDHRVAGA